MLALGHQEIRRRVPTWGLAPPGFPAFRLNLLGLAEAELLVLDSVCVELLGGIGVVVLVWALHEEVVLRFGLVVIEGGWALVLVREFLGQVVEVVVLVLLLVLWVLRVLLLLLLARLALLADDGRGLQAVPLIRVVLGHAILQLLQGPLGLLVAQL